MCVFFNRPKARVCVFQNVDNMNITRTGLLVGFACLPCYMYDKTYHVIIYYTDDGIICVSV